MHACKGRDICLVPPPQIHKLPHQVLRHWLARLVLNTYLAKVIFSNQYIGRFQVQMDDFLMHNCHTSSHIKRHICPKSPTTIIADRWMISKMVCQQGVQVSIFRVFQHQSIHITWHTDTYSDQLNNIFMTNEFFKQCSVLSLEVFTKWFTK